MATARKRNQGSREVAGRAALSSSAGIRLLIFEDNGGDYHWALLDDGGESLAESGPLATYEDAARAARVVCDGAASVRLQTPPPADQPVDLLSRREALIRRDNSDAERWLDEGTGVSSEAVRQWPAER